MLDTGVGLDLIAWETVVVVLLATLAVAVVVGGV